MLASPPQQAGAPRQKGRKRLRALSRLLAVSPARARLLPAPAPQTSPPGRPQRPRQPIGCHDGGRPLVPLQELHARQRHDQDRPLPVARRPISRSTQPLWVAGILRAASSQYSLSISAPTKNRPSSLAATPVVPEPQNGSRTRSPSPLEASRARLRSLRGFWVGW
jgi:hypothetical protein